ncbi:MAG: cytochrome c peroxidase [Chitinophagales bacterium]
MSTNKIKILIVSLLAFFVLNSIAQRIVKQGKNKNGFYVDKRHVPFSSDNAYNHNMVLLGKKLFYDNKLSLTNNFSCASCHRAEYAFADTATYSYSFITNKPLAYNTPSLVNLAYNRVYGYEGKYDNLEEFIKNHIANNEIMNMNNKAIITHFSEDTTFTNYIKNTFNTDTFDSTIIYNAISQYVRTFVSINTSFEKELWSKKLIDSPDSLILRVMFKNLSPKSQRTIDLCMLCHSGLAFGGEGTSNNGLNGDTENTIEYKTANIKNMQLTAPYMHDGRFKTLEEVVEFYNSGIQYNKCLDPLLQENGKPIRLNLNNVEKKEIVKYLNTLMDSSYNTIYYNMRY